MATTNGSLKIMVTGLHNDPVCMCIHGSRDHTKRLNLSLLKKLWGFFFLSQIWAVFVGDDDRVPRHEHA